MTRVSDIGERPARPADVVGVGAAVVDYIGVVPVYPEPDTQVELQTLSKQSGGNVATALVTLSRLGVATGFLGKFSDDELGRLVQDRLHAERVDLSSSLIEAGSSQGFAFIVVEAGTGRRTIMWTLDGKAHLSADELDRQAILSSRYLHLDQYSMDAAIAAARIAKDGGVQVVLDAESMHPEIDTLLPLVDVLIVCSEFAKDYTGLPDCQHALDALYEQCTAHTVAVTAGEHGCYCRNTTSSCRLPAFSVVPVDTTGCGDVFHGAFIYGLLHSWPLARMAEFACAAAALNCRALGGQAGIPTLNEIEELLETSGTRRN